MSGDRLVVNGFPKELKRALRVLALDQGTTLKALIIEAAAWELQCRKDGRTPAGGYVLSDAEAEEVAVASGWRD